MSMNLIIICASMVIMVRCTCMVAKLNHRNWYGHKLQFTALAISYAFIFGGAAAFALGWTAGALLLLFGMAGRVLFDRRERT